MKRFIVGLLLMHPNAFADVTTPPAPLPIFLKAGFSSVLEFDNAPTRVVLGDAQAFQVERLDRSLVLRALAPYGTSNLFVYFKEGAPRLFILTAAEDASPTYFKRIEDPKPLPVREIGQRPGRSFRNPQVSQVLSAHFDAKKDYLTVEAKIAATSESLLRPNWSLVRLRYQSRVQAPFQLWSERKEVQKDSTVRARFIFVKPNIPRDLSKALLIVPIDGQISPLSLSLRGGSR